jgi:hypothetical protein
MPKMYCGNNAKHPSLRNGKAVVGTRYGCLLKGKQIGLSQPIDKSFREPYEPIDDRKVYCGDKDRLPEGYDHFGKLYGCMLKGIGWGKREKATKKSVKRVSKKKSKSNKKSLSKRSKKRSKKSKK